MWLLSNMAMNPASPGLALAAVASYQALNVRLPQLNRSLARTLEALKNHQTEDARRHLDDCDRFATSVLRPAESDQEKRKMKEALDQWYRETFLSFLDAFVATAHKGVTVQERLAQQLEAVIEAFRGQVFVKPYSDPPASHPSVLSHDPTRRPTVPEVRVRALQDAPAAVLTGDTLRALNRAQSVELKWQEDEPATEKTTATRTRNAAFYGMVEEALSRHPGKNLIVFLDRDWKQMRGMATLLLFELRKRQDEARMWLSACSIEVVSSPDRVSCIISYNQAEKKIQISSPRPFSPQTGRA